MQKRLYRSTKDRMLAGVCGGLAEYFEIDPVIIRVLFVVIALGGGVGILSYIILWIIVPEPVIMIKDNSYTASDNQKQNEDFRANNYKNFEMVGEERFHKKNQSARVFISILLILIGILWFTNNIIPGVNLGHLWPLILVALGLLILIRSKNKS